ncbi:MAG: hypothetical protein E7318_11865 [Clostridiales bacterium]|nr:hypothetical protein [Clostridiales bacterium]
MYKKSYKGFVLGLLVFLVLLMSIAFIPAEDEQLPMRLIMLLTVWYMAALSFQVWRTEQVYWYNGTSFEDAEAAGSERRKEFAWRHFRIFGMFALVMAVLSCAMQLLGWSAWIDFTVGTVGICVACFMTIPIKL